MEKKQGDSNVQREIPPAKVIRQTKGTHGVVFFLLLVRVVRGFGELESGLAGRNVEQPAIDFALKGSLEMRFEARRFDRVADKENTRKVDRWKSVFQDGESQECTRLRKRFTLIR